MNTATRKKQPDFRSDATRWDAVVRRDPLADGVFFYSVQSTGIYCRPSCPSRRANRENVRFHASCTAAEAAGFRPCKRCRPNGPAVTDEHAAAMQRACRMMQDADDAPDLDALATAVGMSRFHFQRVFKSVVGVTPRAYLIAHRAQRLREALPSSTSVTAAMYEAGFNSSGRLYADSTSTLGMTPGTFRNGGRGATIRFAVGDCSLGAILIAATDKGVCAILLGDDPEPLLQDLQERFHSATLVGGDADFEQIVARVVGFVDAPSRGFDLPLDVQGTLFQQRIWRALTDIPAGATVSYTELARRVGAPSAVRAVASACAANFIAVAIPCHRVVRNDGALSGYRWGVERKRALIEREARVDLDRT